MRCRTIRGACGAGGRLLAGALAGGLASLLFASLSPAVGADEPGGMRTEKIADGVFAVLQPAEHRFDDSNSAIIVNADHVVVVDAQADAKGVAAVLRAVRERSDRPVRYVINTHWHADHTQGNRLYRESYGTALSFVGHRSLRLDVPGRAAADLERRAGRLEALLPEAVRQLEFGRDEEGKPLDAQGREAQAAGIERARAWLEKNRDARFLAPDVAYDERLILAGGGRELRLLHCRAHTRGDTVVHLPAEKILFTGDLLDDLPYIGHGYPTEWITCLQKLRELDVETIVPGHGPVFRGPEQFDKVSGFLESLVREVAEAVAAGLTLEQTRDRVLLAFWRESLAGDDPTAAKFFDRTLAEAVDRAYVEATEGLTDAELP